jgi:hypothetical protein
MWLGNNSSSTKQRRLLGELRTRVSAAAAAVATDRTGLRTAYLPALRSTLVRPLLEREAEGIPDVVASMQVGLFAGPAALRSETHFCRRSGFARSHGCSHEDALPLEGLQTGWVAHLYDECAA